MRRAEGKVLLLRLAAADDRIAALQAELAQESSRRAEIVRAIANDNAPVDLGTARRIPGDPEPQIPPLSELQRARAKKILTGIDVRRRKRG